MRNHTPVVFTPIPQTPILSRRQKVLVILVIVLSLVSGLIASQGTIYGNSTTNEGYTLGNDYIDIGFEWRGVVGPFWDFDAEYLWRRITNTPDPAIDCRIAVCTWENTQGWITR